MKKSQIAILVAGAVAVAIVVYMLVKGSGSSAPSSSARPSPEEMQKKMSGQSGMASGARGGVPGRPPAGGMPSGGGR